MLDSRWEQLADILVNYSTTTRRGDRVLITMMETDTWPLARAVHAAAVKVGAHPHIEFQSNINCGEIIDGTINVQELGLIIFKQILATASGELTKSEEFGFGDFEFAPWIIGAVM